MQDKFRRGGGLRPVGFYVLECASLDEAIEAAKMLPLDSSSLEIRPIDWYDGGV